MKIDQNTRFWVVTDAGPHAELGDVCFETDLRGLGLQVKGGLDLSGNVALYDNQDEAVEDGKNRLLVRRVAERIRIERHLRADEIVRVTLHGEDGKIIWQGEVR